MSRRMYLVGLAASVLFLALFYSPVTTGPPVAQTFFGVGLGEIQFGYFSLTHGYAALGFLLGLVIVARHDDFFDDHGTAYETMFLAGIILAFSDYAEFLGPYAPWVSIGSLVSIPVGAWFGAIMVKAIE